jgi:hypothetical protein
MGLGSDDRVPGISVGRAGSPRFTWGRLCRGERPLTTLSRLLTARVTKDFYP